MIKYYAEHYSCPKITETSVSRETESFVWLDGRKTAKLSECTGFFDTWDEAHGFLMEKCELRMKQARLHLNYENGRLGNVKGMKKP